MPVRRPIILDYTKISHDQRDPGEYEAQVQLEVERGQLVAYSPYPGSRIKLASVPLVDVQEALSMLSEL